MAAIALFERIERRSAKDPSDSKGEKPEAPLNGHISVRDVIFSYPTRKGFPICNGYNLEIQAGWVVALCGASGSGKSTIINLVQRFYDPSFGTITIDGYDITKLNLSWLRSQIGLVGQEPVLFAGSVFDNISQGKPGGADRSQVELAAQMANAHLFITENLSEGYDTQVGVPCGRLDFSPMHVSPSRFRVLLRSYIYTLPRICTPLLVITDLLYRWGWAVARSLEARSNALPLRAPSCASLLSCCSMKPPRRSTMRVRRWCKKHLMR